MTESCGEWLEGYDTCSECGFDNQQWGATFYLISGRALSLHWVFLVLFSYLLSLVENSNELEKNFSISWRNSNLMIELLLILAVGGTN